jgi:hypothetical protein
MSEKRNFKLSCWNLFHFFLTLGYPSTLHLPVKRGQTNIIIVKQTRVLSYFLLDWTISTSFLDPKIDHSTNELLFITNRSKNLFKSLKTISMFIINGWIECCEQQLSHWFPAFKRKSQIEKAFWYSLLATL